MKKSKRMKPVLAWADAGSHGKIFEFVGGSVGERYPHLMHIYSKKYASGMVRVRIVEVPSKRGKRK